MSNFLDKLKAHNLSETLFTVAFVVAVFPFILCATPLAEMIPLDALSKVFLVLSSGILAIKCALEVWFVKDLKKVIYAFLLLVLTVLVVFSSKAIIFPVMIFQFIVCAGNIDKDRLVKVSFFTVLCAVCAVLFCFFLEILPHEFSTRFGNTIRRWHFGFNYTTHLPNFFFSLVLMFVYLVREKIKMWHILIIAILNLALYFFTDTKAIYGEIIFLCIGLIILRPCYSKSENAFAKRYNKICDTVFCGRASKFIFAALILALVGVTVYASATFDIENPDHVQLDKLISGRLSYANEGLKTYGITPFGTEINWASGSNWQESADRYFFVDSSFVNMLLNYGVIVFALITAGLTKLCFEFSKDKQKHFMLLIFVLVIHSLFDPQLFDLRYTPFLMFLGQYVSPFEETVSVNKLGTRLSKVKKVKEF